jgi:DNA-directed RNA polymerase subunit N (RpoN/RPB10)
LGLLEGFTCGAEVANAFGEFRAVVKKLMGLEH